jgi:ParB/RepB/Spo0J family partition protein
MAHAATPTLVELDPRTLAAHPANIRTELGDLTDLTASIKAIGILEPVIVTPITSTAGESSNNDSGFRILAGHRRVAAALAAKAATVPCLIRDDLTVDVDALTAMIVENVQRADLTKTEEAAAYAQLAAFDLSAAQIAKRTGRDTKTVKDALKLNALPEQVKQPVSDGSITLDEAAAIAEFADDDKAHARLMKAAASGYGLAYAIADERRRRENNARKTANRQALTHAGVKVVGQPKGFPYYSRDARVTDLALADGTTRYTPDSHADCPGHAAFLDPNSGEPVFICRDPDTHGHTRMTGTNYVTPEEAERRAADEAARAERAETLTVAARVRRAFIRDLLNRPKPAAHVMRAALAILFAHIEDTRGGHLPLVADTLGLDTRSTSLGKAYAARLDRTTDAKLWQHTAAHAAALAEANLDRVATGRGWGYRPLLTVTWLDLLVTCGYQPSEIEQQVRDEAEAADQQEQADAVDLDDEDDLDEADEEGVVTDDSPVE